MSDLYPLALRLDGRRVLVVGGGSVATRRVPALIAAGARVRLVSPALTPALQGIAEAGRLEWTDRVFREADLEGVWLVQVAIDDHNAAEEISRLAEERRIFCVRADDRHAASAWTPAVTRHGAVTVAVLAGGDPRLAMAVRDRIAAHLEAGDLSSRVRPSLAQPPDAEMEALGEYSAAVPETGTVALVGGGPGDPELITVKGRRLLNKADVVVADRLAPGLLLDELRPEVEVIDVAKLPYGPAAQQEEINRILIDRAQKGLFVVRLKGGDPFVFGRGGEEAMACAEAGVLVTVVPGVSSAIAVPAAAWIPVTHRGVAHDFTVVSGHLAPDDPGSLVDWPALARMRGTLVILMGLRHLTSIVDSLVANGRDPETPAAIIQEGTTQHQHRVLGHLSTLPTLSAGLRPPAIVVIGDVVSVL
ncbi:MAG TPA: uroporphyrinogen-III C-methyltransferase [Micromonosporaceae bacterium]|nr:uroporphyrinogen-III C-methyltransferase [Micromonosporaceae bacterium]